MIVYGHIELSHLANNKYSDKCIGYDYTAYMDYMDLAVCCPQNGC